MNRDMCKRIVEFVAAQTPRNPITGEPTLTMSPQNIQDIVAMNLETNLMVSVLVESKYGISPSMNTNTHLQEVMEEVRERSNED